MPLVVFNIKTLSWYYPTITGVTKDILMEVTNAI